MAAQTNGHEETKGDKPQIQANDVGWQFVPQY
jgi:hypothetical protein